MLKANAASEIAGLMRRRLHNFSKASSLRIFFYLNPLKSTLVTVEGNQMLRQHSSIKRLIVNMMTVETKMHIYK
jgi:hypothetical protein